MVCTICIICEWCFNFHVWSNILIYTFCRTRSHFGGFLDAFSWLIWVQLEWLVKKETSMSSKSLLSNFFLGLRNGFDSRSKPWWASGRRPWSGPAKSRSGWWTGPPHFPGEEEEEDQMIIAFLSDKQRSYNCPFGCATFVTMGWNFFNPDILSPEVVGAHCKNSTNGSLLHQETAPGLF